jgi:hypothetical protein
MIKLHNWKVVSEKGSPYRAPETLGIQLKGDVYGHKAFNDGDHIRTSAIVSVEGRVISTRSGSLYLLGRIDPLYRKFLKLQRPHWNWRKPITFKP